MPKKLKTKHTVAKPVRPKKLPLTSIIPTFIEEATRFFSLGMKLDQIARAFGIKPEEFREYLRDDPELAQALYLQRAQNVANVATTLYEKATSEDPRNNNAMMFYLENVANFTGKYKESDDGLDNEIIPKELRITTTDATEAMFQYEQIMKN